MSSANTTIYGTRLVAVARTLVLGNIDLLSERQRKLDAVNNKVEREFTCGHKYGL